MARLAALKVLNQLRPRDTVTICLPLFLAGGAGDRAFAKLHPTVTVDGCDLRCAARGTENYSSKPAASLVVNELVAECGLERPAGRRRLNAAGTNRSTSIFRPAFALRTTTRQADRVGVRRGNTNRPSDCFRATTSRRPTGQQG